MKKIILLVALIGLTLHTQAQINLQNTPNTNISNENPFLDASGYNSYGNNEGKGLYFPTTDLTTWEFKVDNVSPETFSSYFDGMIVYNSASGQTIEDTTKGGKRVKVEPGFYYFKNPNQTFPDGSVENGEWVRFVQENINTIVANKTLVYTNTNNINYNIQYPTSSFKVEFDDVPSDNASFTNDSSLEKNTEYLYVTPDGATYVWNPNYNWETEEGKSGIPNGKYVAGPEIGGNSLFYKGGSLEDAIADKMGSIYRPGKIGIGIKKPIADLHTKGTISGASYYYYSIMVDNTKGDSSPDDTIFNTLVEAIEYANTVVNNSPVRIFVNNATETIDKSLWINRDIIIQGSKITNTINLNASLNLSDGVVFAFAEGYDMTVNQNTEVAFISRGGNKIMLGGYSGVTWNFTASNQSFTEVRYTAINNPVQLSFSRATLNTNGNSGLRWAKAGDTSMGLYDISYWQTKLPTDISYELVHSIVEGGDSWQNIVGSETIFSGLDKNNNSTLVEYMRLNKEGNLGIGTANPTEKLEVNGKIKSSSLKGTNIRMIVANKEGVLSAQEIPAKIIINGLSSYYYSITVDNTTGSKSPDDTIFNTLVEAIEYANTIVNNFPVRISVKNATETIDKSLWINRDIFIQGENIANTINLNASLNLSDGVIFGFVEGYGMAVNQNTEVAFISRGGNKIMLGGYSGVTWNFTAPNQSFVTLSYNTVNAPIQLSFSRTVINTNGNSGIGWSSLGETSLGMYDISYWQTTLPEDISYARVRNVVKGDDSWQNIVGSETIFSGLDTNNNNALVEYMRLSKEGNLGIGTTNPIEKLEVVGNIKATKAIFTNLPTYANDAAADEDSNLPSGSLYKLENTGRQVFVKP